MTVGGAFDKPVLARSRSQAKLELDAFCAATSCEALLAAELANDTVRLFGGQDHDNTSLRFVSKKFSDVLAFNAGSGAYAYATVRLRTPPGGRFDLVEGRTSRWDDYFVDQVPSCIQQSLRLTPTQSLATFLFFSVGQPDGLNSPSN